MRVVLKVVGFASGAPCPIAGLYVRTFDFDAHDGVGEGEFTADRDDAMTFADHAAALAFWKTRSTVRPLRSDLQPNRPLTATTMVVVPIIRVFRINLPEGEVAWDIDEIEAACARGEFGSPVEFPTSGLPPPDYASGHLDADKIEAIKGLPDVLARPGIAIGADDTERPLLTFCDGNHRITARYELNLPTLLTYVVPASREREFRIRE